MVVTAGDRARAVLERAADAFEAQMRGLVSIIVREGGRTYADAVAEVREAGRFLPLLRVAGADPVRRTACAPRPCRRAQHARIARPRRVRLH
jgi:RHH-type proline utilization regulon transcriptional repressor/proline dehydrogenase/delta 1-pyrroline-5-carboxylate dehydrogenase